MACLTAWRDRVYTVTTFVRTLWPGEDPLLSEWEKRRWRAAAVVRRCTIRRRISTGHLDANPAAGFLPRLSANAYQPRDPSVSPCDQTHKTLALPFAPTAGTSGPAVPRLPRLCWTLRTAPVTPGRLTYASRGTSPELRSHPTGRLTLVRIRRRTALRTTMATSESSVISERSPGPLCPPAPT